ncbi:hypothetical protein BGZ97_010484 [Linnemannia gamsii]|uniref:DDE Tnp4 domain-containing protein n=1 Tax=Linnemannia gamsii TaxID=64522 RepID=A0A9P6UNX4_9FUNG|nr:hypothetical protein BGZ97_010484 [Linnemannia gamsii]
MHNSTAYKRIYLYQDEATFPRQLFQGHEYLLADAAYSLSETVMPRYRNGTSGQVRFNSLLGSIRATIENAFGMLQLKFQSLQNHPVQVHCRSVLDSVAS